MNALYIQQQGAGNGKTYGLIRNLDDPLFHCYDNFVLVAKQHSVKYILYQEFLNAKFSNLSEIDVCQDGNKFKATFTSKTGQHRLTIRTIDSLMYCLGESCPGGYDMFRDKVSAVAAGQFTEYARFVNEKTCIFIDETQDIPEDYGRAILRLLHDRRCTFFVVGDLLQSIMYDKNAFSFLKNADYNKKIIRTPSNICRRFSSPSLVNIVNKVVNFAEYNLPAVTTMTASLGEFKALYENVSVENTVQTIMAAYRQEAETHGPADFLFVSPFVKNNRLAKALEEEIQAFWIKRKGPGTYVFLHQAEDCGPINLAESEHATRIVSIHTAKGDGRPIVFVINLDESALLMFSSAHNLVYESLLHVAITRMKKKLLFVFKNKKDDVYRRFAINNGLAYRAFNVTSVHLAETLKQNLFQILRPKRIVLPHINPLTDMSHHNLRYNILTGMMYIKFGLYKSELARLGTRTIKVVKHWVDRYAVDYIPLTRMNDNFEVVHKYLQRVHQKLPLYGDLQPCVLEAVFIHYIMNDEETSYILYKAVNQFGWNSKHHQNCPCSELLAKSAPKKNSLEGFYDEINISLKSADEFLKKTSAKWTLSGPIVFNVDFKEFRLGSKIIGRIGDDLYFIFCKTYLSDLNINSLQVDVLLHEYARLGCKVKSVVFALNLAEPLIIENHNFVNENAITIGNIFSACLMSDFDVKMVTKNVEAGCLEKLIEFNAKRPDVVNFLKGCKSGVRSQQFMSAGEKKCAEILAKLFPDHKFKKVRPKWLNRLELDLYCEKLAIALEFNGLQHYQFVPFFHKTYDDFLAQVKRDQQKKTICENRGIRLIVIDSLVNIEDRIRQKLL